MDGKKNSLLLINGKGHSEGIRSIQSTMVANSKGHSVRFKQSVVKKLRSLYMGSMIESTHFISH